MGRAFRDTRIHIGALRKTDSFEGRARKRERERGGGTRDPRERKAKCTRRLRKLSRRCVFTRRFTSGQRAFDLHARVAVATLKRLKGFSR